jgi:hypothetical protein
VTFADWDRETGDHRSGGRVFFDSIRSNRTRPPRVANGGFVPDDTASLGLRTTITTGRYSRAGERRATSDAEETTAAQQDEDWPTPALRYCSTSAKFSEGHTPERRAALCLSVKHQQRLRQPSPWAL